MSIRTPLRLAVWVMERCGVDPAVVGDVAELDLVHPSNVQLAREMSVAVTRRVAAGIRRNRLLAVRRAVTAAGVLWVLSYTAAGHAPVNLAATLHVDHVSSGWLDGSAAPGRTRVVPAVTFDIKNVSDAPLGPVQLNVVFRRTSDAHDWSDVFRRAATRRQPLAPGAGTATMSIESAAGYTGDESGDRLLQHAQFVDATATIYARQGSEEWTSLGSYPVQRVLIAHTQPQR